MTGFVLDNSVAMRWLLKSAKIADQKYAETVLKSLAEVDAIGSDLWHLEASNVLRSAEKRSEINPGDSEGFIIQLENYQYTLIP